MSAPDQPNPLGLRIPAGVPQSMQVQPRLQCNAPAPTQPIPPIEALAKLGEVTQLLYGTALDPDTLSPEQKQDLEVLIKGGTTTGTITQTAYEVAFRELVFKVAARAAADFCFQLLGLDNSADAESVKQGYVCMFLDHYRECSQDVQYSLNFGWMIASLTCSDQWAALDPNCDLIPVPNPAPVYPSACP
jgi:hypothetical protein